MCKFTFKKLISLILCGSAMNCSAAFAMDKESLEQNLILQHFMMDQDSDENSSIGVNNLSSLSISEDSEDLENYISNIPGEGPLPANLLNNNEEHGSQNEDGQVVNEHNQAPSSNAGKNCNVGGYTQAVNEEIHQADNELTQKIYDFLNQKRNSRPRYFPKKFTDGYIWNFKMGANSPSAIKALTKLLRNDNLKQQFAESRSFAPASTNRPRLEDMQWGTNVVKGKVTDKKAKLHRRFFNTISELIERIKFEQEETGEYHAVHLSTPFGIVKTSLIPDAQSLILNQRKKQNDKNFENLDENKQRKALEIIRDYLAESQGGNYSVYETKGTGGAKLHVLHIKNSRYNGKEYSKQFTKSELPCLRRLFFDLVYRFPNKYNDSGIFEIAYINWYLNTVKNLNTV